MISYRLVMCLIIDVDIHVYVLKCVCYGLNSQP